MLVLRGETASDGSAGAGELVATGGGRYAIEEGIPNFLISADLTQIEAKTKAEYDAVADSIYDIAVDWQFAAFREDENSIRESMVDMLGLTPSMHVIEIGCGTGRDSFRLARRLGGNGFLHLQDLSPRMVRASAKKMAERRHELGFECDIDYSVSSATALPFADDTFDAVFHFGGFNQFGDLAKGASELTRIAKPGGRIVFGDEAVAPWLKNTEFRRIVTTNNPLFDAEAPLELLPECARDVIVRWIIGNCFFLIGFTKGVGTPDINVDLPHQGWRGGTMRTRYFGQLEGVTLEAKAMVREAASRAGLSVHEWLDRLVRRQAAVDRADAPPSGKGDRR